jgi:uncharacterized membrane protein YcaP (DUF421 family)
MDVVLRAFAMYLVILVLLRVSGSRSLGQLTAFDFVLLMIVAEATQQALLGDDFSFTTAALVITTLVTMDIGFSVLKQRFPTFEHIIDSAPVVLVMNGEPLKDRMDRVRMDEMDILSAARLSQGLERMDQIKYAVLERSGHISIIPTGNG